MAALVDNGNYGSKYQRSGSDQSQSLETLNRKVEDLERSFNNQLTYLHTKIHILSKFISDQFGADILPARILNSVEVIPPEKDVHSMPYRSQNEKSAPTRNDYPVYKVDSESDSQNLASDSEGDPMADPLSEISSKETLLSFADFQLVDQFVSYEQENRETSSSKSTERCMNNSSVTTLKKHNTETVPDLERTCGMCGKTFTKIYQLKQHKKIHERRFKCSWNNCQKSFKTSSHLQSHEKTHTGEKPFKCDWPNCNSTFGYSGSVVIHKRIHTGEKPYKCPWGNCYRSFSSVGNCRAHERTHFGDGSYTCQWENCGRTFSSIRKCRKHERSHTEQDLLQSHLYDWTGNMSASLVF